MLKRPSTCYGSNARFDGSSGSCEGGECNFGGKAKEKKKTISFSEPPQVFFSLCPDVFRKLMGRESCKKRIYDDKVLNRPSK